MGRYRQVITVIFHDLGSVLVHFEGISQEPLYIVMWAAGKGESSSSLLLTQLEGEGSVVAGYVHYYFAFVTLHIFPSHHPCVFS